MQERCRAEILAATDDIGAGMLEKLAFLDKFIKEVLRLFSPSKRPGSYHSNHGGRTARQPSC